MIDVHNTAVLAQAQDGSPFTLVIAIALIVVIVAGIWKTFEKAEKPGWAALIPIFNVIVLLDIAERPIWWIFLFLVPFVNFIIGIVIAVDIAERFGKGVGFGLGLAFLGFIFYPILGFGSAEYRPTGRQ